MINKIINKLYLWNLKRKKGKKELSAKQQKVNLYNNLKILYNFTKWLNTKYLLNRQQRKLFWKEVQHGRPLMENIIQGLLKKFEDKGQN